MSPTWNRALVTGASSGIGKAIAEQLAAAGTELVVVARDTERLENLAAALPVTVEILTADLGDPEAGGTVAARLSDHDIPIDLLVNNAGLGFAGPTLDTPDEQDALTVAVNVVALHRLCRAAGQAMRQRGAGGILNVSSIAGDMPGPQSATYNATKAFVTSFSEALHVPLKRDGVTVTALCPGLTNTEFQERAGVGDLQAPGFAWQSADEVAAVGLDAVAKGKAVAVSGAVNQAVSGLLRTLPRRVTREIGARARA